MRRVLTLGARGGVATIQTCPGRMSRALETDSCRFWSKRDACHVIHRLGPSPAEGRLIHFQDNLSTLTRPFIPLEAGLSYWHSYEARRSYNHPSTVGIRDEVSWRPVGQDITRSKYWPPRQAIMVDGCFQITEITDPNKRKAMEAWLAISEGLIYEDRVGQEIHTIDATVVDAAGQ